MTLLTCGDSKSANNLQATIRGTAHNADHHVKLNSSACRPTWGERSINVCEWPRLTIWTQLEEAMCTENALVFLWGTHNGHKLGIHVLVTTKGQGSRTPFTGAAMVHVARYTLHICSENLCGWKRTC